MSFWTKWRKPILTAIATYFGAPYLAGAVGGSSAAGAAAGAAGGDMALAGSAGAGGASTAAAGAAGGAAGAGTGVLGQGLGWISNNAGALGSLGGLASAYGQYAANSQNQQLAQQQMAFQQQMSSTAYQRATSDMMAAGLNPMLGYSQGGASSPGGSTANMSNALGPAVASASQTMQTLANVDLTRAQTQKTDADTVNSQLEAPLQVLRDPLIRSQTESHGSSAVQNRALADNARAALRGIIAESNVKFGTQESQKERIRSEASTAQSGSVVAEREAEFAQSDLGRWRPAVQLLKEIFGRGVAR